MTKKSFKCLSFSIVMSVIFCVMVNTWAQQSCSPLDSTGYVLLHPYFAGKNWKTSVLDNINIALPDTLCSQQLRPAKFDIGKSLDSTLAAFSTATGDFFLMESQYFHYAGACQDELDFLSPQKVSLTGITFSGTTPWYLVKDTAYNLDTVKIVFGVSGQYCLVATINSATSAVVKIDTLHLQNTNTISTIQGSYDNTLLRDTCIFVTGSNGMLRRFSYKPTGWGTEVRQDITATETVLCATATYAGTNSGRIYKKNAAQTYILDYSGNRPVNTIYPQGAIGNRGAFIENISGVWRNDTLGTGNYQYANFIETPGGFGVELLDNQWKYSSFTYRDTASKIYLTSPVNILTNNVDNTISPYLYNPTKIASPKDTTISIYISDPDSNYSDVSIALNGLSMKNDGTHSIGPIPDTDFCLVGALKLTDGILKITLKRDSVVLKTQTQLGALNVGCLVCNWKNYSFSYSRPWFVGSNLFIKTGKDSLWIYNQTKNAVTTVSESPHNNPTNSYLRITGNKLILNLKPADVKKIVSIFLYDFAGRKLTSIQNNGQTIFEIPRPLMSGISCLSINYSDGSSERQILPLLR